MEKKNRRISQPGKDDLRPQDGSFGIATIDHDEFAHIPCGEGEDETGEKPIGDIFRIAGEDDQTEGDVHGEG